MGTNFYWGKISEVIGIRLEAELKGITSREMHIGKRSAAGLYCWDCNTTLCKRGPMSIHGATQDWHDACPKCGKKSEFSMVLPTASAVELGFSGPRKFRPKGVASCSSFSYGIQPEIVKRICSINLDSPTVEDEYGRKLTGKEFLEMLEMNCPIIFTDNIGRTFS